MAAAVLIVKNNESWVNYSSIAVLHVSVAFIHQTWQQYEKICISVIAPCIKKEILGYFLCNCNFWPLPQLRACVSNLGMHKSIFFRGNILKLIFDEFR